MVQMMSSSLRGRQVLLVSDEVVGRPEIKFITVKL